MSDQSLNDVMDEMMRRLDKIQPTARVNRAITEIEAYAAVDPLMGTLYKQYLEARTTRDKAVKAHGKNAPMSEIAADLADSAHCAVETRLIELRSDTNMCCLAMRYIKLSGRESYEKKRKEELAYRKKLNDMYDRDETAKRAKKAAEDSMFFVLALLVILQQMLEETQRNLSIAASFGAASCQSVRSKEAYA